MAVSSISVYSAQTVILLKTRMGVLNTEETITLYKSSVDTCKHLVLYFGTHFSSGFAISSSSQNTSSLAEQPAAFLHKGSLSVHSRPYDASYLEGQRIYTTCM